MVMVGLVGLVGLVRRLGLMGKSCELGVLAGF
jgi:hypothetical protein